MAFPGWSFAEWLGMARLQSGYSDTRKYDLRGCRELTKQKDRASINSNRNQHLRIVIEQSSQTVTDVGGTATICRPWAAMSNCSEVFALRERL